MIFLDYFDRCSIINLESRPDRKRQMRAMLKRSGFSESDRVEFFPAIRPDSAGEFPSVGARGCFLSHLEALRAARADRLSRLLVMEDDLEVAPRLAADPEPILDALRDADWGIVYFGHVVDQEPDPGSGRPLRRYAGPIRTTHFYAVNGPLLPRLIAFLETVLGRPSGHPEGGPMHLDGAFTTFRRQNPDVLTLIAWPSLGWQRSSMSNISPSWFDRIPGLRTLAGIARSLQGQIRGRL